MLQTIPKLRNDLEAFIMQFGGRPATNSGLGKRVAKSDCEVDDLLENCPISSTPTVMRASRFLVACQNGQSLVPACRFERVEIVACIAVQYQ